MTGADGTNDTGVLAAADWAIECTECGTGDDNWYCPSGTLCTRCNVCGHCRKCGRDMPA